MTSPIVEIVAATRLTGDAFGASPLGVSLARLRQDKRLVPHIAFENARGLPEIYDRRIASEDAADILVFIHDDIWLDDFHFVDRIIAGLEAFDIVGLAGNRRRQPRQESWPFLPSRSDRDKGNLRGAVAHGDAPLGVVTFYGPTPAQCELLDGVLLAARKSVLRDAGVTFDPRFMFHFYDLDFCRTARRAGLRLGVWPIAVTHRSGGNFGAASFKEAAGHYFEKWGD